MGEEVKYSAPEYAETKQLPFRLDVERHTIFTLAGNLAGKRILDAGCGDGIYARVSVDRGASHVLGVDAFRDFIDLAIGKNKGYEGKIDYHLAFMQNFFGNQDRDIAIGAYILSYPKNLEEAVTYCRAIASHLKKGGMFVGFNNSPFDIFDGTKYKLYGFEKEMHGDKEGGEVIYRVQGLTDPITNYFLSHKTYERAFREAGFSRFSWRDVLRDESSNAVKRSKSYWEEFFEGPPFAAMVATK
ncbi:MAG: class I SAM-dependent methyltransferase [Nanoarchaeota archaeon]